MKIRPLFPLLILIVLILGGCVLFKSFEEPVFYGGPKDKAYKFMESVQRIQGKDYAREICELKYFSLYNEHGYQYQWIREPENLEIFFNTCKAIGIEKFISREEYFRPDINAYPNSYDWPDSTSFSDLVRLYLESYSSEKKVSDEYNYFEQFWNRRIEEGNDIIVFKIFGEIDQIYHGDSVRVRKLDEVDDVLYQLLGFETSLKHADSSQVQQIEEAYFEYLRSIEMYNSAYNLMMDMHYHGRGTIDTLDLIPVLGLDSLNEHQYWQWRYDAFWYQTIHNVPGP